MRGAMATGDHRPTFRRSTSGYEPRVISIHIHRGGRIRTDNLRVMSPASYQVALPRMKCRLSGCHVFRVISLTSACGSLTRMGLASDHASSQRARFYACRHHESRRFAGDDMCHRRAAWQSIFLDQLSILGDVPHFRFNTILANVSSEDSPAVGFVIPIRDLHDSQLTGASPPKTSECRCNAVLARGRRRTAVARGRR
jgi:hypothetical protein